MKDAVKLANVSDAVGLAKQSDSTIIILLVVIVILIIALTPTIKAISTMQEKKRKLRYEREDRFIQVIERNTEVNAALKALIEIDQKHCDQCKQEQLGFFRKMFDNQEMANTRLAEISQKLDITSSMTTARDVEDKIS